MAAARAVLLVAAVVLAANPAWAEGRGLLQLGKGKGKINPVPLAMVSNAMYIQPQVQQYAPAFVAPQAPAPLKMPQFFKPKPQPVALPAAITPVPIAPIYASGVAMPTWGPLPQPKYKFLDFPFIKKVATLGITAVPTPDPVFVPPQAPAVANVVNPAVPVMPGPLPAPMPVMQQGMGKGAGYGVPQPVMQQGMYPGQYGEHQPYGQPQYAQPQYAQPQYAQPQYAQPGAQQYVAQQSAQPAAQQYTTQQSVTAQAGQSVDSIAPVAPSASG